MNYNKEWEDDPYVRGTASGKPNGAIVALVIMIIFGFFLYGITNRQTALDKKQKAVEKLCDCDCLTKSVKRIKSY